MYLMTLFIIVMLIYATGFAFRLGFGILRGFFKVFGFLIAVGLVILLGGFFLLPVIAAAVLIALIAGSRRDV